MSALSNMMTVDVEDWFHILEFEGGHSRGDWAGLESRVEANTDRLLGFFDEASVLATFFVVGWVAERHPGLVRRIAEAGHEIASHSYWHEVIRCHTADSLARDLGASRQLLEAASGTQVTGFRAPGASITPEVAWAFDVMIEQGYSYDASLCPGLSSHGGYPSPHAGPHRIRSDAGELVEIPSSTSEMLGRRVPYAGGGYLRLLPYPLIRRCISLDNQRGVPTNVYVHPREIDPGQPRMPLGPLRRFKYYVGISGTEKKLRALLRDFSWTSVRSWIDSHESEIAGRVLDVREDAARAAPAPQSTSTPPHPPVAFEGAS